MVRARIDRAARRGRARPAARPLTALPGGSADAATDFDRLIHEHTRLCIVSALAVRESLTFGELKGLLGVTDGNLSVHARKLEEAGYLSCQKGFAGRVPRTEYRLTAAGRRALDRHLQHLSALIDAVQRH